MRQAFCSEEAAEVASVSTAQCCPTSEQSISSCSNRDTLLPELSRERCWVCSGERGVKEGKICCATAAGRQGWEMWEEQPCRQLSQCRRRVGSTPGAQQQFPTSQGRSMVEQEVWGSMSGDHGGRAEMKDHELTAAPIPLYCSQGGSRQGWMGSKCDYSLRLSSHYSSLLLLSNKLY